MYVSLTGQEKLSLILASNGKAEKWSVYAFVQPIFLLSTCGVDVLK